GTIKWYNTNKGFGFIKPLDNNGYDVFLHRKELQKINLDKLSREEIENLTLAYNIQINSKGKKHATNI
ncbi:hypothetical protein M569_07297, partial [Genlisea aurea]